MPKYQNNAIIHFKKGPPEKIIDFHRIKVAENTLNVTWSNNGEVITKSLLIPMSLIRSVLSELVEVPDGD